MKEGPGGNAESQWSRPAKSGRRQCYDSVKKKLRFLKDNMYIEFTLPVNLKLFPMLHLTAFFVFTGLLWYFLPSRTSHMRKEENQDFLFRVVAHPDCPVIMEPCKEIAGEVGNN
jgi:hypothetical protein